MGKKSSVAVVEREKDLILRMPTEEDGKEVWRLVKETGVLDLNSSYSYLMWSKFFDNTSVVVEVNEQIVGLFLDLSNRIIQIRFLFGKLQSMLRSEGKVLLRACCKRFCIEIYVGIFGV